MNKIFKVIWCNVTQSWVAVSELQRAKGKVKAKIALLSTATLFINLLGGGVALAAKIDTIEIGAQIQQGTGAKADANGSIVIGKSTSLGEKQNATKDNNGALNGIVIGKDSTIESTSNIAIGNNIKAKGDYSVVIGEGASVEGDDASSLLNSVVIGRAAKSTNQGTIAIGLEAQAAAENAIAIGSSIGGEPASSTTAMGSKSIAFGFKSTTTQKAGNSIAVGHTAKTLDVNSIAFGTYSHSNGAQSLALGSFSSTIGNDAVSIGTRSGSYGTRTNAIGAYSRATGQDTSIFGSHNMIGKSQEDLANKMNQEQAVVYDPNAIQNTVVLGNKNAITSNNTFVLGSNINSKQTILQVPNDKGQMVNTLLYVPIGETVANSVYLGDSSVATKGNQVNTKNQVIIGTGQFANLTTGQTTTAGDTGTVENVTVGPITYGKDNDGSGKAFAGAAGKGVVTVGAAGKERRIQNVAAGEISATSTDAINGSQLYAVTDVVGSLASSVATHLGGNASVKKDGSLQAPTYNLYQGTEIPMIVGNGNTPYKTANSVDAALTNLNTYINDGFKVLDSNGNTKGVVTPGNSVKFESTDTVIAEVVNETNDGVTAIKFSVKDPNTNASNSPLAVVYTDKQGNQVYPVVGPDGAVTYRSQPNDQGNEVVKANVITSINGPDGTATPTILNNVASNLPNTYNTDAYNPKNLGVTTSEDLPANLNTTHAATVGDVLNSGWNLQGNNVGIDFVKPYDTVNFINGNATVATVATAPDGKSSTVKYDVNIDNNTLKIENGKLAVASPDTNTITTVKAADDSAVSVVDNPGANGTTHEYTVDVAVDGNTIKVENGKLVATATAPEAGLIETTDGRAAPKNGDENKVATVTNVADAINDSGWKLVADGTADTELVNPGDTVTFKAGSGNVTVKREGSDITYDLAQAINVDSVQFGNDGPKLTKNDAGDALKVSNKDGGPAKITNVANGEDDNDAVNVSQLEKAKEAATTKVGGDQGVSVTAQDNNDGSKTYTITAKTDGATVKVNDQGQLAAVTSGIATNDGVAAVNGNGVAPDEAAKALVTAGDVVKAINDSGWKLVADGTADTELVNPGDTVTFKAGSGNVTVKREGSDITYDLAQAINVDSVQFGNDGPKLTKNDAGDALKVSNKDGGPAKITNVANGEDDNDAVNVSQLEKAKEAATTKVGGDQGVSVTAQDNNDGSKTYTITAKTDGATVKVNDQGQLAAVTSGIATNDGVAAVNGNGVAPDEAAKALVTAGDVVKAINDSGWKLVADGTADTELVNPGDTVTFKAGSGNVTVKREGSDITYDLAQAINVDSVQFGNDGPKLTKNDAGDALKVSNKDGGPAKITNVANGEDDNDAVNVSQLEKAKEAATTKVGGDQGVSVTAQDNNDGSKTYTITAKTDGATVKVNDQGQLAAVTSGIATNDGVAAVNGNGVAPDEAAKALVTAGDVVKAINDSGWKLVADGTADTELVNPGDTVTFKAGSGNVTVKREGSDITYDLAQAINVDSVQFGNDGPKLTKNDAGDALKVSNKDGGPAKITNVANGEDDNDAVNVSQLEKAKEAATTKVGGDQGVSVTAQDNNDGSKTYTITAKTDGATVKVNDQGQLAAVTSGIATNDGVAAVNGNGVAPDEAAKALVTAGDVVKAINDSGWKLVADGTADTELVNPGDTVTFKAGSGNVTVKREGSDITYDLAQAINVDSVQFGNDGPKLTKNDAGDALKVSNKDGGPAKITNVANGEDDNDAVNVSQLEKAKEAATTKVGGDQGVSVTAQDNNDGSKTYTITAKTDGATVKVNDQGQLAAVTSGIATNDGVAAVNGNGVAPDEAAKALVTAGDVVKAINDSGWKLVADGTADTELVNPGDTVTFKVGSGNVTVKREGSDITYDLAQAINVDSVQFGNDGPKLTKNDAGDALKVSNKDGGPAKITNVANGDVNENSYDAVNGSQLYNARQELTQSGFGLKDEIGQEFKQALGTTAAIVGDGNVNTSVITKDDGSKALQVSLGNDITVDSMTAGETVINDDGVKVGDDVALTNKGLIIADGPSVTVKGIDAGNKKVTGVADGDISPDSTDAVNGSQLFAVKNELNTNVAAAKTELKAGDNVTLDTTTGNKGQTVYTVTAKDTSVSVSGGSSAVSVTKGEATKQGSVDVTDYVVDISDKTKEDINKGINANEAVNNKGLTFATDTGATNAQKLGDTLNVKGDKNITTKASGNTAEVTLNNNLDLGDKGSVKTGNTVINSDGVTIGSGDEKVSLTENGLNNAGNRIANVADGKVDSDAATVGQVKRANKNAYNAIGALDRKVNRVDRDLRAGIAGANAAAALPQAYIPGKSMVAASAGTYRAQTSVALGYSRISDNGKVILKLQGNANTQGDIGGAVGIGYQW